MDLVQLRPPTPPPRFALFALGFRPFFLAAALSAVALVLAWVASFSMGWVAPPSYGYGGWHAHEMIFGYAPAVLAGFLLTAVRNWTKVDTITGAPLAGLVALWVAARVLLLLPDLVAPAIAAAVDVAFLPLLALAIAHPIWTARNRRNVAFPPLLLALGACNLVVHLDLLGVTTGLAPAAVEVALYIVLAIIAVIGGRVFPFFTERRLEGFERRTWPWVERLAASSLILVGVVRVLWPGSTQLVVVALFAAAVHGVRFSGWWDRRVIGVPLLWVLHLSYLWLILGLAMEGLAAIGVVPSTLARHALTLGGIGALTLGMMARVGVGHTGRPLRASRVMAVAFVLVHLAVALRVLGPLGWSEGYHDLAAASGVAWAAAFALFVIVYTPILITRRPDGRPG